MGEVIYLEEPEDKNNSDQTARKQEALKRRLSELQASADRIRRTMADQMAQWQIIQDEMVQIGYQAGQLEKADTSDGT